MHDHRPAIVDHEIRNTTSTIPDTPRAYLQPPLASAVVVYFPVCRAFIPPPLRFCFTESFRSRRDRRQDDEEGGPLFWIFRNRVLLPFPPGSWVIAPELPVKAVKSSSRRFHANCRIPKNEGRIDIGFYHVVYFVGSSVIFLATRLTLLWYYLQSEGGSR